MAMSVGEILHGTGIDERTMGHSCLWQGSRALVCLEDRPDNEGISSQARNSPLFVFFPYFRFLLLFGK